MRKRLWLAVSLLVVVGLLVSSCAGHSEWRLRESEKAKVIEIALNTPEVSERLERESQYKIELMWIAVGGVGGQEMWFFYDDELDKRPDVVPESATFYPGINISFGEPKRWTLNVAVDLETEQVVYLEPLPIRKTPGPTPPKDEK